MKTQDSLIADFTHGSIPPQLMRFAAPLFLSSLLQILYNTVDMVVVGQATGSVGLSAVSVGGDVISFLTFIAIGFSNAGQVIISQLIGAGQARRIADFTVTLSVTLLSLAVLLSAVCYALRGQILHWMNTPPDAYVEALRYATVCILGLVFIFGYNMVSAVLRGMGDSAHPLLFIGLASLMNIALDLLLVLRFHMGTRGAAIATVSSQAISFLSCAVFLLRRLELRSGARFDRALFSKLVRLGIPMALKNAAIHFTKLFVGAWINAYGVAVSAFTGIAHKINSTANLMSNAFSTAGASMVGQNIAAERYDRVKKIMAVIFLATAVMACMFSALILLLPRQIYGLFTGDTSVIEVGMAYIPVAVLAFFGCVSRAGMNALINGSGNDLVNLASAVLDSIVLRMGLTVWMGFGLGMGYVGFWYGDQLAGYGIFLIGCAFYLSQKWKHPSI